MIRSAWKSLVRPFYRRLVPAPPPFSKVVFAEQGEDGILWNLLSAKRGAGFYVDVGAFHPQCCSVTYSFYLQGWRGINIEPRPGSRAVFDAVRPRDINLEVGVGDEGGLRAYFEFDEPMLNGLCRNHTAAWQERHGFRVVAQEDVPVMRLETVLQEHLPAGQPIDFLSIDVEGGELAVLESNDWRRYRPEIVLVEDLGCPRVTDVVSSPATRYLAQRGYSPVAKTRHTIVYRLDDRIDATRTD